MGPWGHVVNSESKLGEVDFGPQSLIDMLAEELRWFNRWLKGYTNIRVTPEEFPVRIFVMGANEWRDEREWPLARTQWMPFYLHSGGTANSRFGDGTLSINKPENEPSDTYQYNPAHPVPFITDPTSSQIGGPDDYSAIERRDDVLVYMTELLNEEVEVTGPIRVDLYASSSTPDTDFMAKLVDIWPSGFVQRLCDGMVRARFREGMDRPSLIEPGKIYKFSIDCWNTCQVFKTGHRIGLEIVPAPFPKYDRNLNTGAPLGVTTEMAIAEQRIYHECGASISNCVADYSNFINTPRARSSLRVVRKSRRQDFKVEQISNPVNDIKIRADEDCVLDSLVTHSRLTHWSNIISSNFPGG